MVTTQFPSLFEVSSTRHYICRRTYFLIMLARKLVLEGFVAFMRFTTFDPEKKKCWKWPNTAMSWKLFSIIHRFWKSKNIFRILRKCSWWQSLCSVDIWRLTCEKATNTIFSWLVWCAGFFAQSKICPLRLQARYNSAEVYRKWYHGDRFFKRDESDGFLCFSVGRTQRSQIHYIWTKWP